MKKDRWSYFLIILAFAAFLIIAILIFLTINPDIFSRNQKPQEHIPNCTITEEQIRNAPCTSNYGCRYSNAICDLNTWRCVNADENLKGQVLIPSNKEDCEMLGGIWS